MQIFYLDTDPILAARMHNDRHVVKMILESAQLLSTAHYVLDGQPSWRLRSLLQATHEKHPCTQWVCETSANYDWLVRLMGELIDEHQVRYPDSPLHKFGRAVDKYSSLWVQLLHYPRKLRLGPLTEPVQALPPCCRRSTAVGSYRAYYRSHKALNATWKHRGPPDWWDIESLHEPISDESIKPTEGRSHV